MSIYNVSPKCWPTFHDLWSRNGWDPFRHCDPPYENSAFSVIAGLPHKGNWTQAKQILLHVRGLKGLTIHRKNFRKIRTQQISPQPKLNFLANKHRQNKILVSIYTVSPKIWPTFRELWPRNGLDPFRHCDPPYKYSAFFVLAGLPTRSSLNLGQPNFAICYGALVACNARLKFWRPLHPKNFTPWPFFDNLEVSLLIRREPCAECLRVMAHYTRKHRDKRLHPKKQG